MVFTTYLFVFYFLPLFLVLYYALDGLSRRAGASDGRTCLALNTFLVLASYIFYGWWNPWFIFLMLGITVVNYVCGRVIGLPGVSRRLSFWFVTCAIVVSLGTLGFFKYFRFLEVNLNQVLEVHRGKVKGQTIYVGHYNPFKPRSEAADRRVQEVGGNLKSFRAGQVHRMALEESMFDRFPGGILNLYSKEDTDPIYWAVWTNLVSG